MTTDKQITVPKKKKTTTVKSKPTDGEKAKAKAKAKPKSKPKPDPKVIAEKTASNKKKTNQDKPNKKKVEKIENKTKSTKPKKQKVIPILIEYIFPKMEKYVDPVEDIIKRIVENARFSTHRTIFIGKYCGYRYIKKCKALI